MLIYKLLYIGVAFLTGRDRTLLRRDTRPNGVRPLGDRQRLLTCIINRAGQPP